MVKNKLNQTYDLAIIGGGINGCGIAADAASRGLSVFLCDKDDIASHTSSSSSKLIHGGLRYLEYFDFSLVKKALKEREILQNIACHLVKPIQIIIPQTEYTRSKTLIRLGLFIYDHLYLANTLTKSSLISRQNSPSYFIPLQKHLKQGFSYFDCSTNDARLTLTNALQAHHYGAHIQNYTKCTKAEYQNHLWQLELQNKDKYIHHINAKVIVNATGPFASSSNTSLGLNSNQTLKLVKGSHLLLKKQFEGQHGYLLQHRDQRVVFVIPYCGFTMIGTTDLAYEGNIDEVKIDSSEISYLLNIANHYFTKTIATDDIISSWSGVRPLLANGSQNLSALSRDFEITYLNNPGPALTIWGGKITTYRQLASDAVDMLRDNMPNLTASKTQDILLPGATNKNKWAEYQLEAEQRYAWLPNMLFQRFMQNYGTRIDLLLKDCHSLKDLGTDLGMGLTTHEVDFLIKTEWAKTAEDILSRRTNLIYHSDTTLVERLNQYMQTHSIS